MKVILLDDVANLGQAGELVEVKNGYGRNYLVPRGIAEMATRDAINRVELIKRAAVSKRAKRDAEAAAMFSLIGDKVLTLRMKAGSEGRIFGAVTSAQIVDEIKRQVGVVVERRFVMLEEPIKHLGDFTVPLRASAEVTGEVKLVVAPELRPGQYERKPAPKVEEPKAEVEAEDSAPATPVGAAEEAAEVHEKYEEHEVSPELE